MNGDATKLTVYFGERARTGGGFLADALVDVFARHELRTSVVLRGVEGFGAKHGLRTDRLLTLSEDLPLVSVAVDEPDRIDAALAGVRALPGFGGLVTLERARLGPDHAPEGATKLTVYLGRQERVNGRPASVAVVELLQRRGIAGATVLLGVDGTAHGVRQRARFFARNAAVPLMVIAIGDGEPIAGVLGELRAMLARPLLTLERVTILKRDGVALAALPHPTAAGPVRQKIMVYASELSQHDGGPLHRALVRELRAGGAAGATSLRGIWGYHGDHAPHGDTFWQLRRRVPVVVTIVDAPERVRRWFPLVDRLTEETGLVTSEIVPVAEAPRCG